MNHLPNPFDFRRPVSDPSKMVGAEILDANFKRDLDALKQGSPRHIFLIGAPRSGKSSTLNYYAHLSREAGALPVPLSINDGLVESPASFFRAILWTVAEALDVASPDLESVQALLPASRDVVGDAGIVVVAAFERLERVLDARGYCGGVLLLDRCELFNQDDDVLQVLDQLLAQLSHWTFVLAGEHRFLDEVSDVFPALLRRARRLRPIALTSTSMVHQAIVRPTRGAVTRLTIGAETLYDLSQAARQSPFRLQVLAALAWAGVEPLEPKLELTAQSIVRAAVVIEALEYESDDRDDGSDVTSRLEVLKQLNDEDLKVAAPLGSFEAMSVSEFATAQCLRDGCDLQDLRATRDARVAQLDEQLDRLETIGVVSRVEGRFRVEGDELTRLLPKYLAKARGIEHVPPIGMAPSYGGYMAFLLANRVRDHLVLDDEIGNVAAIVRECPESGYEAGTTLEDFAAAARSGDGVRMAEAGLFVGLRPDAAKKAAHAETVFVGLHLRVGFGEALSIGIEEVECGLLCVPTASASPGDLRAGVEKWSDDAREELAGVGIQVVSIQVEAIEAETTTILLPLIEPSVAAGHVIDLYRAGDVRTAAGYLKAVLHAFNRSTASRPRPSDWWLGDLYQRLAFISALAGDFDTAESALDEAGQYSLSDSNVALLEWNRAFVLARRGLYAAAATLLDQLDENDGALQLANTMLLLYFPAGGAWTPPSETWNTAVVSRESARSTLLAQAAAFKAMAGAYTAAEFWERTEPLLNDGGDATARLVGWSMLNRFADREAAIKCFGLGADAGSDTAAKERDYAVRQTSSG